MSKRNIIFICVAVAVIIVIAFTVYFTVKALNKTDTSVELAEKIIIEKYDENSNVEKTIEITNKKQIKELKDICENPSLEQDDNTVSYGIRHDVKIDLGNEKFLIIQLDLPDYCYYEDTNSSIQLVIKMPEGLLDKVNELLAKN